VSNIIHTDFTNVISENINYIIPREEANVFYPVYLKLADFIIFLGDSKQCVLNLIDDFANLGSVCLTQVHSQFSNVWFYDWNDNNIQRMHTPCTHERCFEYNTVKTSFGRELKKPCQFTCIQRGDNPLAWWMVELDSTPFTSALIQVQTSLRDQITSNFRGSRLVVRGSIAVLRRQVTREFIRVDPSDSTWCVNGRPAQEHWCVAHFNVDNVNVTNVRYMSAIHALHGRYHITQKGRKQIVFDYECDSKMDKFEIPLPRSIPRPVEMRPVRPISIRDAPVPAPNHWNVENLTWGDSVAPDLPIIKS